MYVILVWSMSYEIVMYMDEIDLDELALMYI